MQTTQKARATLLRGLVALALAGSTITSGVFAYADEVPADDQAAPLAAVDPNAPAASEDQTDTIEVQDATGQETSQDEGAAADTTANVADPATTPAGDAQQADPATAGDAAAEATADAKAADDEKKDAEVELTMQSLAHANLPAGAYEIRTSYCAKVLDIASGKYALGGALVQTHGANGTIAQRWYLQKVGEHYVITNGVSGLALDMGGENAAKDTQLTMASYTGDVSQQWDIFEVGGGESYEIVSVANGMALDVKGKSSANGAKVQIHNANHSAAQRWKLTKIDASVSDGTYVITSFAGSSYAFDVQGGSKTAGAVIQAHKSNGSLAQAWKFTFDEKVGAYRIRSVNSGKLLGLPGSKTTLGLQVQQLAAASDASQLWSVTKNADGSYSLTSVYGGRTLGLEGATLVNDAKVVLQTKTGDATQKWSLGEATLLNDGLYLMATALDTSKIIDIKSGSTAEGATAQLWSRNNTLAQKWVVTRQSDGSFSFMNANSGRYLADSDGVLMHADSPSSVASWNVVASDAGGLSLVNVGTGRALDVKGGKKTAGTVVNMHRSNGTAAQSWYFSKTVPIADGDYIFTNVAKTSQVLGVKDGSTDKKAVVQLSKSDNGNSQKWNVKKNADGSYTITNLKANLVLDVVGGKAQVGTGIQLWSCNNTAAQKWLIDVAPTGGLSITSRKAAVVLGTKKNATTNGTAVVLAAPKAVMSSTWRIKKTAMVEETDYVAPSGVTTSADYQKKIIARANAVKNATAYNSAGTDLSNSLFHHTAWSQLNRDERELVLKRGSATDWYIAVDKGTPGTKSTIVNVLHYNNGSWQVVRTFKAYTKANTFGGVFIINHKALSAWTPGVKYNGVSYTQAQLMNMNPYWMCYYHLDTTTRAGYPQGVESGQGFHGAGADTPASSGGCVALPDGKSSQGNHSGNAEWLYQNVPVHTTVDLF